MNYDQKQHLETFRGVQAFLDSNAAAIPAAALTTQRSKLDAAVEQLSSQAAQQDTNRIEHGGSVATIDSLRAILLEQHMRPISKTAGALSPDVPAISELRMPRHKLGSQRLVNAARAMRDAAAPHADVFTQHGQAPDFLDRLGSAAQALETAVVARNEATRRRVGATQGVQAEVKLGRRAVQLIDAVVRPTLLGNPTLLAEWKNAKRVGRKPGRPRAAKPKQGNSTTVATVSTAPTAGTSQPEQPAAQPAVTTAGEAHVAAS